MDSIETVKTTIDGALGIITLDRPRALNALDQPMCRAIDRTLATWSKDDRVAAVLIRSSSERAFCAGGDVRLVHDDGMAWKRGESDGRLAQDFFRDEYLMNHRIRNFPKPYIALIDGITMGGGVGLSIHGDYRVATERTLVAMPETGIGLFPDVGTSYVLPRIAGEIGTYLALSGARIKAADALVLGIATHAVPAGRLTDLIAALTATVVKADSESTIETVLERFVFDAGAGELSVHRAWIDRCFKFDSMEEILAAVEASGGTSANSVAATLRTMSPTSLKLTLTEMRRGRVLDFDSCLRMEYRLSQHALTGHDFYEGVRAQLVDKNRTPKWRPATLDAVDESTIESFFLAPRTGDLIFPN